MATILFLLIALIFIGLGLPDSLLGAAWPAIYIDLNLPISFANFITILISLGTVVASFFSAKIINKFGTGLVTAISTLLTAIGLIGFSISNSMLFFCLFSIPLGVGAGAIDAAINNYVAVNYNSLCVNLVHCFYGLGVAISPFIMGIALSFDNNWELGYRLVFFIQIIICLFAFLAIPLWNKVNKAKEDKVEFTPITLTYKQMAENKAIKTSWFLVFSSVALEFTCGIWGCSFLVGAEFMAESTAAKMLTLYYAGMTIGRLLSGFISTKLGVMKTIFIGHTLVGLAIITLILPFPAIVKGVALFFIGFGNGPTFPNITYLTPINFGKEVSQSIISSLLTVCNIGILIIPPIFGLIAEWIDIKLFPIFLLVLYLVMIISTIIYHKTPKQPVEQLNAN